METYLVDNLITDMKHCVLLHYNIVDCLIISDLMKRFWKNLNVALGLIYTAAVWKKFLCDDVIFKWLLAYSYVINIVKLL